MCLAGLIKRVLSPPILFLCLYILLLLSKTGAKSTGFLHITFSFRGALGQNGPPFTKLENAKKKMFLRLSARLCCIYPNDKGKHNWPESMNVVSFWAEKRPMLVLVLNEK